MLKKIFLVLVASISLFATVNSFADITLPKSKKETDIALLVENLAPNTRVHVEEGWWVRSKADLSFGLHVLWEMTFSGIISDLSISYWKNDHWEAIPGCARGTYSRSVQVYVRPSTDPYIPVYCETHIS